MNTLAGLRQNGISALKLYLLVYGILLVTFHQFIYNIPESVQWVLFVGTMLVTGIPHGAIDHLVDEKNLTNQSRSFSMGSFLAKYLSRMAVYALLWWFFPIFAITIFIGISAYHFGETDLMILPKHQRTERMFFLSYGWMLLNVLFFTHQSDVILILNSLPHFLDTFTDALVLLLGQYKVYYFTACVVWLLGACYNYYLASKTSPKLIIFILIQGLVLMAICAKLPFLLAFSFYFGLWHSLLCLQSIRKYLMENSQLLTWNKLVKKAALFSTIAIIGIIVFTLVGNQYSSTSDLLFWLFIGIAILTAPHMEVMSDMFSTIKSSPKVSVGAN